MWNQPKPQDRPARSNSHDVAGCAVFTWLLVGVAVALCWWGMAVWRSANQ